MKEQNNSIDDLFKKQLADYEMEAPMHLLDGILKDKNKKRGFIWWKRGLFGIILLALAGIGLLAYLSANDNSSVIRTSKIASGNTPSFDKTNTKSKSITSIPSTTDNKILSINNNNQSTPLSSSTKTKQVTQVSQPLQSPITIVKEVKSTTPDINNNTSNVVSLHPANTEVISSSFIKENKISSIPGISQSLNITTQAPAILQKTDCSNFGKLYSGLYAEVSASFDAAQRQFSAEKEIDASYLETREDSEQQNIAYSAGFHLTALTQSGLSLTSGFDYHQISEKFIFQDGFKTIMVIEEIKNANGDVIRRDTLSKTVPRIQSEKNKYHLMQIPLLLGFEINAQNYSMGVFAGPILNVVFKQEVRFLSRDELVPTDYSNNHNVFRKNLGIGWQAGVKFGYRINGRNQITFQPYIQSNPKSFTQDDFPIKQKYFITGIRFGWKTKIW